MSSRGEVILKLVVVAPVVDSLVIHTSALDIRRHNPVLRPRRVCDEPGTGGAADVSVLLESGRLSLAQRFRTFSNLLSHGGSHHSIPLRKTAFVVLIEDHQMGMLFLGNGGVPHLTSGIKTPTACSHLSRSQVSPNESSPTCFLRSQGPHDRQNHSAQPVGPPRLPCQ